MIDSGRVYKSRAIKIIGQGPSEFYHPGPPILPPRVVFLHPKDLFTRMENLSSAGKNLCLSDHAPRLAIEPRHPRVTAVREALTDKALRPAVRRTMDDIRIPEILAQRSLSHAFLHQENPLLLQGHAVHLWRCDRQAGGRGVRRLVSPRTLPDSFAVDRVRVIKVDQLVLIIIGVHHPG